MALMCQIFSITVYPTGLYVKHALAVIETKATVINYGLQHHCTNNIVLVYKELTMYPSLSAVTTTVNISQLNNKCMQQGDKVKIN